MQNTLRLIRGESAYTFYGFSYFFRRQTLRGCREIELRKAETDSQQQPRHPKEPKHLMSICGELFSNAKIAASG